MKKPSQLRAYFTLAYYTFLATTRNRASFIFGFIFPLVFISIFGFIGGGGQQILLGVPDSTPQNPIISSITALPVVKLKTGTMEDLTKSLRIGKLDAIVTADQISTNPPKYSIISTTTSGNPQGASAANSLLTGVISQQNLKLSGVTNPPILLTQQEVSGRQFRFIDFALPGQIGFSVLSTAIFSTVFGFIALKRMLVLKRMFATPTKPLTILLAQASSRLVFALLQTLMILIIGVLVFKFYLPQGLITLFELIILSIIGLIAFLGFGFFLAGLANDENSAGPLVNLVTLPQFLLSGTFFSTDNFPNWLQPIANNLPLSYFNLAARKIATEGASILDVTPYLIGILIWGGIMYFLATRTFKWE